MCNRKSQTKSVEYLSDYYSASYGKILGEIYSQQFHENAYDYKPMPIITASNPKELIMYHWGFVAPDTANEMQAKIRRQGAVNCRSEDMYTTSSFTEAINNGQRCLIPSTGFYEHQHQSGGKFKIPYFISLIDQELFSIGGIYTSWKNPATDQDFHSYALLTTKANPFMAAIHSSGARMPVIIPREFEKDWLSSNLTKEDVLAMCVPLDEARMKARTVSKLLTSKGVDTNVPEVQAQFEHEPPKEKVKKKKPDTTSQTQLLF